MRAICRFRFAAPATVLGTGFPTGVRNIMLWEDGFPIMTADGNGRTDLLDPHSYAAVDVYRGPSSALFGNYAYGGAINFRTFSGAEIDGVHTGSEFGSFGYVNNYIRVGKAVKDSVLGAFDLAFFASDANSSGWTRNSFSGKQGKFLGRWEVTPTDRVIVKYIANNLRSEFINRENLGVFYLNPFQQGCAIPTVWNAQLCNNLNVPVNGISTPVVRQSVWQLGTHSNTLRQIGGVQFEHDFDKDTTWRTQFTYDYFDLSQRHLAAADIGAGRTGRPGGHQGSDGGHHRADRRHQSRADFWISGDAFSPVLL